MNYLALVQRFWMESGASGTSPGPSTVISQTGEYARLVTWIDSAWQDIQTAHRDWDWMRCTEANRASFTTVAGQSVYSLGTGAGTVGVAVASLGMWDRFSGRAYNTSSGTKSEIFLNYIDYDTWRDRYMFGAFRSANTPAREFSIAPDKSICIPPALVGYTITLEYFTAPTHLALDADTPALPEWFHLAIVWRALMLYAGFEGASEAYDRGEFEFGKLMRRMDADRLPEVKFGGALA